MWGLILPNENKTPTGPGNGPDTENLTGEQVGLLRMLGRLEAKLDGLAQIIREGQEELADSIDHLVECQNRVRDALAYLLSHREGPEARKFQEAIEKYPGHPEDRTEYESLLVQVREKQRYLNLLREEGARAGHPDPARQIEIEDLQDEINELHIKIRRMS